MTSWDWRTFRRALLAASVALALVGLITAVSDEGRVSLAVRWARTMPLVPLCSAIGAALALGTGRARAESASLEALGRNPAKTTRMTALGAALPSFGVAAFLWLAPAADVSGFYPSVTVRDSFTFGAGSFASPSLGVRVHGDGELEVATVASTTPAATLPGHAEQAAAATTMLLGLSFALAGAAIVSRGRRRAKPLLAVMLACGLATLLAFQGAAAHVVSAWLAVVPAALLLANAAFFSRGHRRAGYR